MDGGAKKKPDAKKPAPKGGASGGPPPGQRSPAQAGPTSQKPPMPGEGIDPYAAMAGAGGGSPFGPPPGPPEPDGDEMMAALGMGMMPPGMAQSMSPGLPMMSPLPPGMGMDMGLGTMPPGDPYATLPGEPDRVFDGVGEGDPKLGLQEMLTLLMLAQSGVGGGVGRSSSGLTPDPRSNIMAGMGVAGGDPGAGMMY